MKNSGWKWIGFVVIGFLIWGGWNKFRAQTSAKGEIKVINARIGNIRETVSTTGTVLPRNRLQVKPPVNGRIEKVLVQEGQLVKAGETIALMSSTDRAALLDAARGQGEEKLKYWEDVYRSIPLVAPIDGEVIVGTVQPGQTVTTSDAVIVLSDRLIVRAQVDETDIGKIKPEQKAIVSLDAYPGEMIDSVVDHIYYESKTVNNVTIYEVDLAPQTVPPFFRSGMTANIDFIQQSKEDVLTLPVNAVHKEDGKVFVMIRSVNGNPVQRPVELGLSDDKNAEIVSGLSDEDEVILKAKNYKLPQTNAGSNPLMPARRR